jgi:hypothetical protein
MKPTVSESLQLGGHPRLIAGAMAFRLRRTERDPTLAADGRQVHREAELYLAGTTFDYDKAQHNAHLVRAQIMQRRVLTLLAEWSRTGAETYRRAIASIIPFSCVVSVLRKQPELLQGVFGRLLGGHIQNESFQSQQVAGRGSDSAPLLPNPLGFAGCSYDPIRHFERSPLLECRLNLTPYRVTIVGMDHVGEADAGVLREVGHGIPGELQSAVADELHGPMPIVAATVGHAGQVAHQC